jgi:hypothetical protein
MSGQQKSFYQDEQHTQQKYDDGNLVDAMHHFEVDVAGSGGILLAKEVSPHLPQREELLHPIPFFLICFHI